MNKKISYVILSAIIISSFTFVVLQITRQSSGLESGRESLSAAVLQSMNHTTQENRDAVSQKKEISRVTTAINSQLLKENKSFKLSTSTEEKEKIIREITRTAIQRKEYMKQIMSSDPRLFLANAIKKNDKDKFPIEAQKHIEQLTTVTGQLLTKHIDDFKNQENSRYEYYIQTPNIKYSFYSTSEILPYTGATVSVIGYAIDDQLVMSYGLDTIKKVAPAPALESVGDQKTLVVLVKSFASDPEPFSPSQAHELIFKGQFQNFMKEQSYGKISFSGDVFGWVPFGQQITSGCTFLEDDKFTEFLRTYNVNISNYDRVVFLLNDTSGGCSVVGKINYNIDGVDHSFSKMSAGLTAYNDSSWWGGQPFSWTNLDYLLAHEMGHSLGLLHANGWNCKDGNILYGDCIHIEYGNYFDTMGNMGHSLHYNAYFKEKLGWLPQKQVLTINRSGKYQLNALESGNGTLLAKVNILNSTINPYAIEFRRGIGFDANLNSTHLLQNQEGVLINKIQNDSMYPATEILDLSPAVDWWSAGGIQNASLNLPSVGRSAYSLVDVGRGITIGPITKVSSSSISFSVGLQKPVCQRLEPKINNSGYSTPITAGGNGAYYVVFTNQDYYGCSDSQFDIIPNLPAGWSYSIDPAPETTLGSGLSSSRSFNFTVPADAVLGTYSIGVELRNMSTGLGQSIQSKIDILEPVKISNISPESGEPGTFVTITGTGFEQIQNYVSLSSINLWSVVENVSSSQGKIVYQIPSIVYYCDSTDCGKGGVSTSTPEGFYLINVSAYGSMSNIGFQVKKAESPVIPVITSLSTNANFVGNQGTIEIFGSGFDTSSSVIVFTGSGMTREVYPQTATPDMLTFIMPSDLVVGSYQIKVRSQNVESNAVDFTVVELPTRTRFR